MYIYDLLSGTANLIKNAFTVLDNMTSVPVIGIVLT